MAKISIAGAGMIGRPGVAAKMFSTLAEAGINIQLISTSEVKVSCTVDVDDCDRAIAVLCDAFDVTTSPMPVVENDPALIVKPSGARGRPRPETGPGGHSPCARPPWHGSQNLPTAGLATASAWI
jgi:predicted amino acid-binding ACT domain protein